MAEWLSYSDSLEDGKGEVDVDFDAALADEAFRTAHPTVIQLTVTGFETDEAGMPTEAADDALFAVEERIELALANGAGALAVTILRSKQFEFIAYATSAAMESTLAAAVADPLKCQSSSTADPGWTVYAKWALAGDDLESARDVVQVDEWSNSELFVDGEVPIVFEFEFDSNEAGAAGERALEQAGFSLGRSMMPGLLRVRAHVYPSAETIGDVRRRTTAVVSPLGGRFIGWGIDTDD